MNPHRKVFVAISSFVLAMVLIACSCSQILPINPTPTGKTGILTNPDSLTVTSAQAGVVTSSSGASIAIPAGAVPKKDDGSVGSMIFSITLDTTTQPFLPGGFIQAGPVVNLGPDGFVFEQPVTISLPIPASVDMATVAGGAYYNTGTSTWSLVPGNVDETTHTVQVTSSHLSTWAAYAFPVGGTLPGMDPSFAPADLSSGGFFDVERPKSGIRYIGPDARYTGATSWHGVCVEDVLYDDPSIINWWLPPLDYAIKVDNYWGGYGSASWSASGKFWLPAGSYRIIEFVGQSEVNQGDPLYIPKMYEMWRSLGSMYLAGGGSITFPYPDYKYAEDGWTVSRPPCWGNSTTSVGIGDLQVTLNWNSNADLDLHIIEPGGEEIYYHHTTSASGGQLDRDNLCGSSFILGRPENIYWTNPPHGDYEVKVKYYQDCNSSGPVNFTVRICKQNRCDSPISGRVGSGGDIVDVAVFQFP